MSRRKATNTYWCDVCGVPLLGPKCYCCGGKARSLGVGSLVPVFRPEINDLKKQINPKFHCFLRELETWVSPNTYTYRSHGHPFLKLSATTSDVTILSDDIAFKPSNRHHKEMLATLRKANSYYIQYLQYEAESFIRQTVEAYNGRAHLVSFSGGKDSTVVSHLVMDALGRSDILHVFADTTIEMPGTYAYIESFQRQHPLTPFVIRRSPHDFFALSKAIGPPSRILRWCCTTQKTNSLAKFIDGMSPKYGVLTFDGVRRAESARRALYPRVSKQHKIARELLASPIIDWTDLQVWIYILCHGLSFNQEYKKGFRRVGCLYCPFNSRWSQRMIKNRYPRLDKKWHDFLLAQAKRMEHENPENFADNGWRVRAGGRGLEHQKASIESAPCALSDTALTYHIHGGELKSLRHFLRPLGPQSRVASNNYAETFLIHDYESNEIMANVEVGFEDRAVRINYLLKKNKRLFRQRVEKQLRKLQSCILCGACSAKCQLKAIDVEETFMVDADTCISCLACVKHNCPIVESLKKKGK